MKKTFASVFFALLIQLQIGFGSSLEVFQQRVVANASELAIIPITPQLFKWDKQPGYVNQIEYTARISQSPDLPGWLKYTYEGYNSVGYLYGVPPPHLISINLDVIGRNKNEGYDVRKLVISLEILRKNPMEYIVEMKIDNMNVKDLCIPRRMNDMLNVLSDQMSWSKTDGNKVVPIFLASAVDLGENRVPVKPTDAEGVVIHFASDQEFSPELKKLQVEVLPLWKLRPCPRDMKRTSMERHFRRFTFLLDWCSFRLVTRSSSGAIEEHKKTKDQTGNAPKNDRNEGEDNENLKNQINPPSEPDIFNFRSDIPERGYGIEILIATIIPGSIGGLIGFLLIALLWNERDEDAPMDADSLFFEAAFRMLFTILRIKQGNGKDESQYIYHQAPQVDSGVVILTRDKGHHSLQSHQYQSQTGESTNNREISSTPLPPQYGETHPNGTPALMYAV